MLKAMVGITDDAEGARYEAGEAVPAALVERAPWLLEQGHVVDTEAKPVAEPEPVADPEPAADSAAEPEPAAEVTEDTVADEPAAEEA
jgi:hypothetical protein